MRPFTLACLGTPAAHRGWSLYRRTFAWHVALRRLRYLASFPALAVLRRFSPA